MKILVFSDIHIHNFKHESKDGGNDRLEHSLRCLKMIFAYAAKNDIKNVFFTGDLFEQQKSLPTIVINRVLETFQEIFDSYPDVYLASISGNHDHDKMNLISNEASSSQTWLSKIFSDNYDLLDNRNVHINMRSTYEDKSEGVLNLIGIPYYEYGEDFTIKLKEAGDKLMRDRLNILMIHQTPKGVKNSEYYKIDTDDKEDLYSAFDLVLCGHIHLKQRLTKNFLMVGAPIHQDFGDTGTDKGFWIIDTEDLQGEHKFVNLNGKFPTFVKTGEDSPLIGSKEGDYVQVIPKIVGEHAGSEGIENFRADLAEKELLENYMDEVAEDDPSFTKFNVEKNEQLLNVGIDLIG